MGYTEDMAARDQKERDALAVKIGLGVKIGVWAFVIIVLLILLDSFWPWQSVPTGSRGVVTKFGAIVGIDNEGLNFIPPWEKLSLFSIRSETATIDRADGATKDIQPVFVSLTVRYAINTDQVSNVFEHYSHTGDLASYVQTASQEVFKAVTAGHDAPELITKRALVSSEIYTKLGEKLAVYGARVINIDMRNFEFTPQYLAATNQKTVQEQLKLAADNKLKTVESEQKQKVAVAEAEASAVKATADGNAYSIKVNADADAYEKLANATAEAKALTLQNQAIAQSKDVLELRRIEVEMQKAKNWKGELPSAIYGSAPIPFLQVK